MWVRNPADVAWFVVVVLIAGIIFLAPWRRMRILWRPAFTWKGFNWKWVWVILTSPAWLPLVAVGLYKLTIFSWVLVAWMIRPTPAPNPVIIVAQTKKVQEKQQVEDKELAALKNCFNAKAVTHAFGGPVTLTVPAGAEPQWVFVGVIPPKTAYVPVHVRWLGQDGDLFRTYLVDGDDVGGRPLPADKLASRVVRNEPGEKKTTSVFPLDEMPANVNMGNGNGWDLSVMYLQTDVNRELKFAVSFELPKTVVQCMVEVGLDEVVLTPPREGIDVLWVVPIHDGEHQSRLTAEALAKILFNEGQADGTVLDWDKVVERAKGYIRQRPPNPLPYQPVKISVNGSVPETLDRHRQMNCSGQTIRLRLHTDPDDKCAKYCPPAKVLVGWQKPSASSWGLMATK